MVYLTCGSFVTRFHWGFKIVKYFIINQLANMVNMSDVKARCVAKLLQTSNMERFTETVKGL